MKKVHRESASNYTWPLHPATRLLPLASDTLKCRGARPQAPPYAGEGPGTHRLRMCKSISKISVKLSVYYSLPHDILTSSSNERLGKCLRCRLPVNHSNEVFALASRVCWLNVNASRFRR